MAAEHNDMLSWGIGGGFAATLGGIGTWAAQRVLGKAAFQDAINTGFSQLLEQEQKARSELRAELATERARCDANMVRLFKIIAALKGSMAKAGLDVPDEDVLLQGEVEL